MSVAEQLTDTETDWLSELVDVTPEPEPVSLNGHRDDLMPGPPRTEAARIAVRIVKAQRERPDERQTETKRH